MNSSDKRYAFDQCSAHALPGNRMLLRNPRNGKTAVLTPDVYGALLGCREFRTLDDHAARLARLNPALEGQAEAVRSVLASVKDDGLMISADAYAVTLQPASDPHFNVDKPVAAVITWERPKALARCLDSVREHCDLGNLARFIIVDDSRSDEVRRQNRMAAERFAEGAATPVLYFGAEEQKAFLEAIIRQVPAIEAQVRFLIDRDHWAQHWTSGLARTLALLLSVGQRLLVLDDDILCEVHEPDRQPGVRFADEAREATFYGADDTPAEAPVDKGRDPFVRHLRTLGSTLDNALGALGASRLGATAFDGAALEFLERLRPDSRVLITECGSLGDAGTTNLNWLASLEGASLERLLADDDTVEKALRDRNCWHGRRQAHVLPRANMSQLTGLDHRGLLPPYIPIMRGEDRLFGDMVAFLHPGSVVVDQAWALPHRPIPARSWSESERRFDTSQPFPRFAMEWVERHADASWAEEPLKRLGHLARLYEDLADRSPEQVRREHAEASLAARARDYRELHLALDAAPDAPQAWRAFIEDGIGRLNRELIEDPAEDELRGYPENLEGEALVAWWREFWGDFAKALRAWPAIRQAARQVQI